MRKICHSVAVCARSMSICSAGAERRPTIVLASKGKNAIAAVMITFEDRP